MKKILTILLLTIALPLWAQLNDQQAATMLRRMQAQGLSAQQIAVQLSANGVTEGQLLRIKSQMQQQQQGQSTAGDTQQTSRLRSGTAESGAFRAGAMQGDAAQRTSARSNNGQNGSRSGAAGYQSGNQGSQGSQVGDGGDGGDTSGDGGVGTGMPRHEGPVHDPNQIFGHDVFNNKQLTFETNLNIATPENYVLGPGDEVIIDVWGNSQQTVRQTISPDGIIMAPPVGQIRLSGLSIAQANARVRGAFANVYGLEGGGTFLSLTLSQIRSIQVHVMGEAQVPGTYTVSSLSTLFHVLYNAGGVNEIGSLRDIRVNRGGKEVAKIDVYDYLLHGRSDLNIALHDGDVVVVKPYANLVKISGKVKRAMRYELKADETLRALLDYAGGFAGDAYEREVRVVRRSGDDHKIFNVMAAEFGSFLLTDCDEVSVDEVLNRFDNRVEIQGAVFRPGAYALGGDVATVRQLVAKAEGLRGDVFDGRAVIYRKKADYTTEALAIDMVAIMRGEADDVVLRKDDVVDVPSIFDLNEAKTIDINGAVGAAGTYPWADNMTLEDFVVRAGGLLESASLVRVDVAQRIKDRESTDENRLKSIHLSFALNKGLVVEGDRNYILKPFDVVYVRCSPGYGVQRNVSIEGQVLYSGQYAMTTSDERLSDIVQKAGGLTKDAYVSGARLMRRKTADEMARENSALGLTRQSAGGDSLSVAAWNIREIYPVAIRLDKALENPGSDSDLVLREGDQIVVPEYLGTVTIAGAVIYPNTVAYDRNARSARSYVAQAGGFASRARRSKTYVIHMNGSVDESRFFHLPRVTPGSMVVVPLKGAPRNPVSAAEVVGMATSVTSLGAIVTSLMNMSK